MHMTNVVMEDISTAKFKPYIQKYMLDSLIFIYLY